MNIEDVDWSKSLRAFVTVVDDCVFGIGLWDETSRSLGIDDELLASFRL